MSEPTPKIPLYTMGQQWESLATLLFKDCKPSQVQYEEMRKSFCTGFTAAFMTITLYANQYPEDEVLAYLKRLQAEVDEFDRWLRAQAAKR